jgi:hypothetical protein
MTAMILCIIDHAQWTWARNDFGTRGYAAPARFGRGWPAAARARARPLPADPHTAVVDC